MSSRPSNTKQRPSAELMQKRRNRSSRASGEPGPRVSMNPKTAERKKEREKIPPAVLNRRHSRMSKEGLKKVAMMQVADKWAPPRKLTDDELQRARTMFNQLDGDGSGDIDVEELGKAMRQLGQAPTDMELRELIISVDEGDMDGKLQFREFCKFFALGLDTEGEAKVSDAADLMNAVGVDPRNEDLKVDSHAIDDILRRDFDLDVHVNEVFGVPTGDLSKLDMERMVMKTRDGQRPGADSYRSSRNVTF